MKKEIHASDWMKITEKEEIVDENPEKVAEIDIYGVIGGSFFFEDEDELKSINTKEAMRQELKTLAEMKVNRIIVNINSPGGSVDHGISIHDLLAQSNAHVTTNISGMTASIATVIGQAGKVRRISDNSLYLIHPASYGLIGRFNGYELKDIADDLSKIDDRITNIYAKRSGVERAKIEKLMKAQNGQGKWITAKEAKEFGLIDEIYEPMEAAAMLSKDELKKYRLPIPSNMSNNDNSGLQHIVDNIKSFITDTLGGKKEVVEPKDTIPEVPEVPETPEVPEVPEVPVVDVTQQQDDTKVAAELEEAKQKIANLEAELLRANTELTKVGSTEGREDMDDKTNDPIKEMLERDLATLRGELGQPKFIN